MLHPYLEVYFRVCVCVCVCVCWWWFCVANLSSFSDCSGGFDGNRSNHVASLTEADTGMLFT